MIYIKKVSELEKMPCSYNFLAQNLLTTMTFCCVCVSRLVGQSLEWQVLLSPPSSDCAVFFDTGIASPVLEAKMECAWCEGLPMVSDFARVQAGAHLRPSFGAALSLTATSIPYASGAPRGTDQRGSLLPVHLACGVGWGVGWLEQN